MALFEVQNVVNESGIIEPFLDKIDPIVNVVPDFLHSIEYFLGGLFGLYVIYFLFSLIKQRKEIKLLKEIRQELQEIKEIKKTLLPKKKK